MGNAYDIIKKQNLKVCIFFIQNMIASIYNYIQKASVVYWNVPGKEYRW